MSTDNNGNKKHDLKPEDNYVDTVGASRISDYSVFDNIQPHTASSMFQGNNQTTAPALTPATDPKTANYFGYVKETNEQHN